MQKKTPKGSFSSKNKDRSYQLPKVKVINFKDEFLSPLPKSTKSTKRKSKPAILPDLNQDNDGTSWGRRDSENSGSCSKDIDAVSTLKVVEQWNIVEDILYENKDRPDTNRALLEECQQWNRQLPHLRIIGTNRQEKEEPKKEENKTEESDDEEEARKDLYLENLERRRSSQFSVVEITKLTAQNRRQIREYVLDNLLEYVCSELSYYQQELEEATHNFGEYLDLSSFDDVPERADFMNGQDRSNENPALDDEKKIKTVSSSGEPSNGDAKESQPGLPNTGRPRPGMVFGEKIIVSPVPCPISTRESFTAMKISPMQLVGRPVEFTTNRGHSSRTSHTPSSRPTSISLVSKPHFGWYIPDYFTPTPQNVKLSPIELPALPNHTKRSTTAATYNHRRVSLNPLNFSDPPKTKRKEKTPNGNTKSDSAELLEIQGTRITANNKPNIRKQRLHK